MSPIKLAEGQFEPGGQHLYRINDVDVPPATFAAVRDALNEVATENRALRGTLVAERTITTGAIAERRVAEAEVARLRGLLAEALAEADRLDAADSGRTGAGADDPNETLARIRREAGPW